jgi:hypothetical protein
LELSLAPIQKNTSDRLLSDVRAIPVATIERASSIVSARGRKREMPQVPCAAFPLD